MLAILNKDRVRCRQVASNPRDKDGIGSDIYLVNPKFLYPAALKGLLGVRSNKAQAEYPRRFLCRGLRLQAVLKQPSKLSPQKRQG